MLQLRGSKSCSEDMKRFGDSYKGTKGGQVIREYLKRVTMPTINILLCTVTLLQFLLLVVLKHRL